MCGESILKSFGLGYCTEPEKTTNYIIMTLSPGIESVFLPYKEKTFLNNLTVWVHRGGSWRGIQYIAVVHVSGFSAYLKAVKNPSINLIAEEPTVELWPHNCFPKKSRLPKVVLNLKRFGL